MAGKLPGSTFPGKELDQLFPGKGALGAGEGIPVAGAAGGGMRGEGEKSSCIRSCCSISGTDTTEISWSKEQFQQGGGEAAP